jgi:hypothetical protein
VPEYDGATYSALLRLPECACQIAIRDDGENRSIIATGWVGGDPLADAGDHMLGHAEPNPRRKLAGYAALGRVLFERLGPVLRVVLEGAQAGDPELRELVATIDRERLTGAARVVEDLAGAGALRHGLDPERARDILWTLISPEVCRLLVEGRGWSLDQWERWLAGLLADALLRPEPSPSGAETAAWE